MKTKKNKEEKKAPLLARGVIALFPAIKVKRDILIHPYIYRKEVKKIRIKEGLFTRETEVEFK